MIPLYESFHTASLQTSHIPTFAIIENIIFKEDQLFLV